MKTRLLIIILLIISVPVTSFAQEPDVCGPDAELVEGICQMIIVYDAPHEVDGTFLGIFFILFLVIIFGIVVLVVVWRKRK